MKPDYAKLFADVEGTDAYWAAVPLAEFSRALGRALEVEGLSRSALARRLECSRAYVTKVLGGEENVTVATMARFARAVGAVVHVHVAARTAAVRWIESHDGNDNGGTVDYQIPPRISPMPAVSFSLEAEPIVGTFAK